MEVPEGDNGTEIIFEGIMADNFPKLMKSINLHISEVQ